MKKENIQSDFEKLNILRDYYEYSLYHYDSNDKDVIAKFHEWYEALLLFLSRYLMNTNHEFYTFICNQDIGGNGYTLKSVYNAIKSKATVLCDEILRNVENQNDKKEDNRVCNSNKVFIVHGHNDVIKEKVARFLQNQGLEPIILHEQPDCGKTIIEKFEKVTDNVGYAIILLSADDEGKAKTEIEYKNRARQNVIFEMGFFIGKLSRNRVFLLQENGVEQPSDMQGIVYTPMDEYDGWQTKLVKNMNEGKVDITFDYYDFSELTEEYDTTSVMFDTKVVALTSINNTTTIVPSLKSLQNADVVMLEDKLSNYMKNTVGANPKTYKKSGSLFNAIDDNSLIVLDYNVYNYYRNSKLDNYKVKYIGYLSFSQKGLIT